jgi:hypothetical protein
MATVRFDDSIDERASRVLGQSSREDLTARMDYGAEIGVRLARGL